MRFNRQDIEAIGTVWYNRLNKYPLKPQNIMKKGDRGPNYNSENNDICALVSNDKYCQISWD